MNCDYCSDTATIFLTQILGEGLKKICLCETCSKNEELMKQKGLMQAFSDSLLPPHEGEENESYSLGASVSCECGFSLENLSSTGRMGCPTCYETFSEILIERVKSLHRGTKHVGKELEIPIDKKYLEKKLGETKKSLADAIKNEEFEAAAALRDDLTKLESDLASI